MKSNGQQIYSKYNFEVRGGIANDAIVTSYFANT